jgi:26S proteasome regulatory subunit T4
LRNLDALKNLFGSKLLLLRNGFAVQENFQAAKKEFGKTEDDLKSLQSVGQIIGKVLRPLDNERCK